MVDYNSFLKAQGLTDYRVEIICQGMSYRSYKRIFLADGKTLVLMLTPVNEPLEDGQDAITEVIRPYVKVNHYLQGLGIHVPKIIAIDESLGLVLLEDLGDKTFYDICSESQPNPQMYNGAIEVLACLYNAEPLEGIPHYNEGLATIRGEFFLDDYLPAVRGGQASTDEEYQEMATILHDIYQEATKGKWGTILWDYHSPNLLPALNGSKVGVLDFQDAKYGPMAYDLASLLYDARYLIPSTFRNEYFNKFVLLAGIKNKEEFRYSFELLGLLRNLGVLGRFARCAYRDGRPEFVEKIAVVWPYVDEVLQTNPYAAALQNFLNKIMPKERHIAL